MALCQIISRKSIHLPFISTENCLVIKETIAITPNQLLQTFAHVGLRTLLTATQTEMYQDWNLLREKYHLVVIDQRI